jgi:hypothetical protein
MNSTNRIALALTLLVAGSARADVIYTTTAFSGGTTTDYTTVTNYTKLPYGDTDGSNVNSSVTTDIFLHGHGLKFDNSPSRATSDTLTYTLLPTGTTEVGFYFNDADNAFGDYLASAEFIGSGGYDVTYTGSDANNDLASVPYMGFTSSQAFTTVILTFDTASGSGDYMSSYVSYAPASVPEPTSILMTAGGLALAGLIAWRRRRAATA